MGERKARNNFSIVSTVNLKFKVGIIIDSAPTFRKKLFLRKRLIKNAASQTFVSGEVERLFNKDKLLVMVTKLRKLLTQNSRHGTRLEERIGQIL